MSTFTDVLSKIKAILLSLSGLAPLLSLVGVAIPPVATVALPATIALMGAAEAALGDGTGPLKKEAVTAGMVAFSDAMKKVSTGGQKETWEQFTPEVVSASIDVIANVANTASIVTGGDVLFDDSIYDFKTMGQ
jgi:hypothetical protein